MRLLGCALTIASLAACSSTAQVKAKHAGTAVPEERGWLQLQGIPEVEAAQLDDCEGTATVLEAVDERGDPLEIMIGASDPDRSIGVTIIVDKHIDRSRGLQLTGVYRWEGIAQPKQVNVMIGDVAYTSRSGTITLDHAPGTISGTFVAEVVRSGDESAAPIHVEGHFDAKLSFSCFALPPATPDPNAQGGEGEVEGGSSGPHWVSVGLNHPFCRGYR